MHKGLLSFFIVLIGSLTVFSAILLTQPVVTQAQSSQIAAIIPSGTDETNPDNPPTQGARSLAETPAPAPSTGIGSFLNNIVNSVKNLFNSRGTTSGEPKNDNSAPGEPKYDNNTSGGPKTTPGTTPTDGSGTRSTPTDGSDPSSTPTNGSGSSTGTSDPQTGTNIGSSNTDSNGNTDNSNGNTDSGSSSNDSSNESNSSSGSSSGGSSSGGSSGSKTSSTATTTTVAPVTIAPLAGTTSANQPTVASCQTGFPRPLIFGVSSSFHQGGYGPLAEKEGGLIKAGSTMATVPLNWDETIQKDGPNDYNPEAVNFPIRKAVQTGRVVVVNISGTPNWAKQDDEKALAAGKAQPNKADPVVNREFRELVTQAVRDNKDKVKYWSYWNEPNGCMSSTGGCGYTSDSLEDFAYWHRVFYQTVKAEDPSAKIIFGNLDFTKDNSNFIRDINKLTGDKKIEYDYLGLNVYNKTKNAKFPIEWAKAGYDAQRSDNKKPVWLNEWGFDTLWWGCQDIGDREERLACINKARGEIVPLVEDGLNKIRDNDWIYAAQYHHINDEGGAYGLWEDNNTAPRPGGIKFLELVNNRCNPTFSNSGSTPTPEGPRCVTSSSDLGGNKLKRGQKVTFSSVANVPINRFKYNFYIPNSAGSGPAVAFCLQGLPAQPNDNCPTGSGQLVIESRGDNEGAMQAADWLKLPNNQVVQSIWKGNIGSNRRVPFDANFGGTAAVNWNFSNYVSNLNIGGPFRPMAEIDAMATYSTNNKIVTMEMWRNNQMWYNNVPFLSDGSYLDWGKAEGWKLYKDFNSATDKNFWPGTGLVTARSSFVGKDNKLWHIYWRGDEEWARGVPIVNGNSDSTLLANEPNKGWVKLRTTSDVNTATNTTGKIQALTHIVMPNGDVQEQIWINNQVRKRTIPQTASGPDFSRASAYEIISSGGLTPPTDQADSISVDYETLYKQDTNRKNIPDVFQVNTTFETVDGKTIGNHSSCVTWFTLDKSIPGDLDGNCLVDIYDYNILMEQQGKTNCAYNIAGDCKIDANDINQFIPLYGNKCPAN